MTEETVPAGVDPAGIDPVRVIVAVCTYRRNEPLERLLKALERNAAASDGASHTGNPSGITFRLGVVVVDDNPDARARPVCDRFAESFPLGLHCRHVGSGNISIARNTGLETALPISDWIAMTDDDCEPGHGWIRSYLTAQRATGADALTGSCLMQAPAGSPKWLTDQPFFDDGQFRFADLQQVDVAATNNSLFRSEFFRDHPEIRFDPRLGVIGGEDMVFFRSASAAGLRIHYSATSVVTGHEPIERTTFRYQVRSRFWLGNTEFVTNDQLGDGSRPRWLARAARRLVEAIVRPFVRLVTGRAPQLRYSIAAASRALGNAAGALGVRVRHH